jgi:hypothetical protein
MKNNNQPQLFTSRNESGETMSRRKFLTLTVMASLSFLSTIFVHNLPVSSTETADLDKSPSQIKFRKTLQVMKNFFQKEENKINLPKTTRGELERKMIPYLKNLDRDFPKVAEVLGLPTEMREYEMPFPTLLDGPDFSNLTQKLNYVFARFFGDFFSEEEIKKLEDFYSMGLKIEQPVMVSDYSDEANVVSSPDEETGEPIYYFKPEGGPDSERIPLFKASDPRLFKIPNNSEYELANNVINSVAYRPKEKTGLDKDVIVVEVTNSNSTYKRQIFILEFDSNGLVARLGQLSHQDDNQNNQTEQFISTKSVITNTERGAFSVFKNAPEFIFVTFSQKGENGLKNYYITKHNLSDLINGNIDGEAILRGNEEYKFLSISEINSDGTIILLRTQPGTESKVLTLYNPNSPEEKREVIVVNITKNTEQTKKLSYPSYVGEIGENLIFYLKGYGKWNEQTLQYGAVFSIPKSLVKQKIRNREEILESDFTPLVEYNGSFENYALGLDIVESKDKDTTIYAVYRGIENSNLVMWRGGQKHKIEIPEKGYYDIHYDDQTDIFFVTIRRHAKPATTYQVKYSNEDKKFLVEHIFTDKWHPNIPKEIYNNIQTERQDVPITNPNNHTISGESDQRTTIPTIAIGYSEEGEIDYEKIKQVDIRVYGALGGGFFSTNLFDPSHPRGSVSSQYAATQEGALAVNAGPTGGSETFFEDRGDPRIEDPQRHKIYEESIDVVLHYGKLCPNANINLEGASSGGWTAASTFLYAIEKSLAPGADQTASQRYTDFLKTLKKVNLQVPLTDPLTFATFNSNAANVLGTGYWDSVLHWKEVFEGSPVGILVNIQEILTKKPELKKEIRPLLENILVIIQFATKDEVTPPEQSLRFYALLKETFPELLVLAYSNDTNHSGFTVSEADISKTVRQKVTEYLMRGLGSIY